MAIELSEEQLEITMRYLYNKMRNAKVNITNTGDVVRYMILNPLPDHKEVAAEDAVEMEKERRRRIVLLTEELAKLEGN